MANPPLTTQHVQQALRGDRDSLGWVVGRFSPLLKTQAIWRLGPRLGSQVDPDDVVAEAWLVALRRLGDLDREGSHSTPRLLAFLGTTILNIVNRRIEEAARRTRRMAPPAEGKAEELPAADEWEATMTGAVTQAMRTELASSLKTGLASLAQRDREVILLRTLEGLSNLEVAAQLGEAPTTVSHRYRRALGKLRASVPKSFLDELPDD